MKNHKLLLASLIATLILITSCKESDQNLLQEAQLCLNKATASTARACISKISSDVTPLANSLRCSAIFISEGFSTPSSFINALNSINNTGSCTGGCSSTVNALTVFKFTSSDSTTIAGRSANNAVADEAFVFCSAADAKIYAQIASLFKLGTRASMLAIAANGTSFTQDQLETQIANLDASEVGDLVSLTYKASCTGLDPAHTSESTKKYCDELTAATGVCTTSATIGACMKAKLADPSAVCCN